MFWRFVLEVETKHTDTLCHRVAPPYTTFHPNANPCLILKSNFKWRNITLFRVYSGFFVTKGRHKSGSGKCLTPNTLGMSIFGVGDAGASGIHYDTNIVVFYFLSPFKAVTP